MSSAIKPLRLQRVRKRKRNRKIQRLFSKKKYKSPMGTMKVDPTKQLSLPPGFRFYPTDEELLVHYLCRKIAGNHFALQIIGEIDLYKYDPWVLPGKALFGEKEWYFFSPRDRKYPNGSRPNRVAGSGYWKATGTDKIITSDGRKVGIKKALVFYIGKAPKGTKTNWIMHEYRLSEPTRKKGSVRLDDWVLCRLYKKNSGTQKPITVKEQNTDATYCSSHLDDVMDYLPEINDSFFDLPRINSLKSLQDPKLFQNMGGRKISQTDVAEIGSNCQKFKSVNDFYFPSIPDLCAVDSPSDRIESTVEDEVESDLRSQQGESPNLFQSFPHLFDPFEFAIYSTHPEYVSLEGMGKF